MTENILKPRHSKLPIIIFVLILCLAAAAGLIYLTYCYQYYLLVTGSTETGINITLLVNSMAYVGQPMTFIPDLFQLCLKKQLTDIWFVYMILAAIVFVLITSSGNGNSYKGMEQGSAHFASEAEKALFSKDTTGIPCGKDFYVPLDGKINGRRVAPNLNELVWGGSGAGKSFRKIMVDIMQMWGSYVITDPKGELFRNTYKLLKANGYTIKVLNMMDIRCSNTYNPFDYMESEEDVLEICSLFMSSASEGERKDFFVNSAEEMLRCISVYLFKADYETKTFGRVIRLVNSIKFTSDGKIDDNCELSRCMQRHMAEHPYDSASVTWPGLVFTAQETFTSVQKTLSTKLSLWTVESVDMLMNEDEMDFDMLGQRKTAIFVIVPVPHNPYKVVANVFFTQLFSRLFKIADEKYSGRWKELISFELDEFAQIGTIPDFHNILAIARSYNIRICPVLQDISQLKVNYKDTWETLQANCAITTFLGSTDDTTLKHISEKLNNFTAQTDSRTYNRSSGGGGSDTQAMATRPLLYPNEIKRAVKPKGDTIKYDGSCIVWVGYEEPFYMPKFDTLNHPLIGQVGGPYGTPQYVNNTDIRNIYVKRFDTKKADYERSRVEQFENMKAEETAIQQKKEAEEVQEQMSLNEQFYSLLEEQPQLPLSDEEEENREDAVFVDEVDDVIYADDDGTYQSDDEYNNVLQTIRHKQLFESKLEQQEDIMPEE